MATVRRGASSYSSIAPATSHNVPLPTGSQANDLVLIAATAPSWSTTFTFPGTEILDAGITSGTMHYAAAKKRLTSEDITAGYLTVGLSTSQQMTAVCVGYSSAGDFGTPGTVWEKDGVTSVAATTSPAIASNGSNDVLVFSLIKHSGTFQALTSVSPTTTELAVVLQQGPGVPTMYAGVFTGTPADRIVTWSVTSSNGVGFQIPVLDIPPVTGVEWNEGNPAFTGAVTSGTVTIEDKGAYDAAKFIQGAAVATLTWPTEALNKYSVRYYLHTPATAWPDTAAAIFHALSGATLLAGNDLAGSFNPGQFRWKLTSSTEAFRSAGILSLGQVFRIETQVDTVAGTIRGAAFGLGSNAALYDSGVISASVGTSANGFSFGRVKTMASLQDISISRIKIVNTVGDWIGRHEDTDPLGLPPEIMGVWEGGTLVPVEVLGIWNGTSVDPVETIFVV